MVFHYVAHGLCIYNNKLPFLESNKSSFLGNNYSANYTEQVLTLAEHSNQTIKFITRNRKVHNIAT